MGNPSDAGTGPASALSSQSEHPLDEVNTQRTRPPDVVAAATMPPVGW